MSSINWEIIFYIAGIYGLTRFFYKLPKEKTENNPIKWKPVETICVTLGIYYLAQILGTLLAFIYPEIQGWSAQRAVNWAQNSISGQFVLVLLVEAISILSLYLFLRRRQADFRSIGLIRPKWRDVGYVVIGFAVYFIAYILVAQLTKLVIPNLNLDQQQQVGFNNAHGPTLIPVFISLVLLPPIAEELLTRGFLYSGLRKSWGVIKAALATSLLFALAHLQSGSGSPLLWTAAIDTFVLSLVLVYLREKTGSLWASIGLHMLKNGIAFLALFVFRI